MTLQLPQLRLTKLKNVRKFAKKIIKVEKLKAASLFANTLAFWLGAMLQSQTFYAKKGLRKSFKVQSTCNFLASWH